MSNPRPEPPDDLAALERRLAGWRPATGTLNRDRMLFEAGRASVAGAPSVLAWRVAAGLFLAVSVGLGVELTLERSGRIEAERAVAIARAEAARRPSAVPAIEAPPSRPVAADPPPTPAPDSYFALTQRILSGNPPGASPRSGGPASRVDGEDPGPVLSPLITRGTRDLIDL